MLLQVHQFPVMKILFLKFSSWRDNQIDEDIDDGDVDVKDPNRPSIILLEEALDKLYNHSSL